MSIGNRSLVQSAFRGAALVVALLIPARGEAQNPSTGVCAVETQPSSVVRDSMPDLAGVWDFRIDMSNRTSAGFLALGHMDGAYAGSLTPAATNTVVIRRLTLLGDSLHMSVATREGEVTFDGRLASAGAAMCGLVTYHGGVKYPMTATRRGAPRPS